VKQKTTTPKATQPGNSGFVSDKYLSIRYEVSRATWWRWVREGDAPKPYRFTSQCTRWKLSEVLDWEAEQEGA
jgi:predicted DNA-binding transcriptional regulator AlpA